MENPEYLEYDVSRNVKEKAVNIKEEIKTEFPENLTGYQICVMDINEAKKSVIH